MSAIIAPADTGIAQLIKVTEKTPSASGAKRFFQLSAPLIGIITCNDVSLIAYHDWQERALARIYGLIADNKT